MNQNQYGIDVKTLDKFISQPEEKKSNNKNIVILFNFENLSLKKIVLATEKELDFEIEKNFETTFFLESGRASINGVTLISQNIISYPAGQVKINADKTATIYAFSGPVLPNENSYSFQTSPFDFREKYWGSIQTIVNRSYAAKKIFCRRQSHSSFEFHCRKIEGYYIHSGKLLVRLRAGRGEDRLFELPSGTAIFMPPGLMHQRGGLEDTIIFELSTHDEDSDSFLIEDGAKVPMPGLK